jgi:hypothetical protein
VLAARAGTPVVPAAARMLAAARPGRGPAAARPGHGIAFGRGPAARPPVGSPAAAGATARAAAQLAPGDRAMLPASAEGQLITLVRVEPQTGRRVTVTLSYGGHPCEAPTLADADSGPRPTVGGRRPTVGGRRPTRQWAVAVARRQWPPTVTDSTTPIPLLFLEFHKRGFLLGVSVAPFFR